MEKKVISYSHDMKGILDDDYTLYDDGTIYHLYDKHSYPGGQNIEEYLTVDQLGYSIKKRLFDSASNENKSIVQTILKLE
ncbi:MULTISPECIES: hypothetical protein [Flavobacterium]|uniref:hypothetical protein n=1 Tax=Flavobacterium TaxID=237 RepID=UPI001183D03F|nr:MULTISPECIES: hypothetical protein [Flavobacterium]MCR4030427.1 hypothetical protein [Flavobacterium panacis]